MSDTLRHVFWMMMAALWVAFCLGVSTSHAGEPADGLIGPVKPAALSCEAAIRAAEEKYKIPDHLLLAIAMSESGRWDSAKKINTPWPWVITNGVGNNYYLQSKDEAIAKVKSLQQKKEWNIDVGCMQINLHHHAKAFPNLDAAFDPAQNVEYAAQFLLSLRASKNSWSKAVALYHSANKTYNLPYRKKVYAHWRSVKRYLMAQKREALRQAFLEKQDAHYKGDNS